MKNTDKDPLYILDGYGLIYRSYFAFIKSPVRNRKGRNISAVFGFFRTLLSLLDKRETTRLAVMMDSKTPTFRHEMFPAYKATRDKSPDELHEQIPLIEELLELMGIPSFRVDGFEADDLMGTLAMRAKREGRPCFIVSGDKDLLQFVEEGVGVIKPEKGNLVEMDSAAVHKVWGVKPGQIVDYLSLVGDSSDNVPGVAGVGAKGAVRLLNTYDNLDGIYAHLDEITAKAQKRKLEEGRESAYLSRDLVKIRLDVPLEVQVDDLVIGNAGSPEAAGLFIREGMPSLARAICPDLSKKALHEDEEDALENTFPEGKKGTYTAVLTEEALDFWIQKARSKGILALDTETGGLDPMQAPLLGISLSVGEEEACYIPLAAPGTSCLSADLIKAKLKPLLEDGAVRILGQNIKYDYKVLFRWGIEVNNICFDTMVAAWMLDAGSRLNMDFLARRYLNYTCVSFKDVVPKGGTFADVPLETAVDYAAEDADITWRLYEVLNPLLEKHKLKDLFESLELPLLTILAKMEIRGILLNRGKLEEFGRELEASLEAVQQEIYSLCGREFNINSTKQLQEILFTQRKLQPLKKTKSGYSTDTSVLQRLAEEDPVPEKILIHRSLAKLKSTYVDTLPTLVHPETGRIHTSFVQTGTATGRIASRDPNLQNIPIRDENGRRIRRAFYPQEASVFLSADYSQIELVVLAHLSGDPGLKEAFLSGQDVHKKTAATIFKVPLDEVQPFQRRVAKTINFGVMYGMSPFRLSNELKISRGEAAGFINTYFEEYSGIKAFTEATVVQAEKDGGVYTILGRFRPIPGITSRNKMEKSGAVRMAVNTRIQGSAADIVKRAMLGIDWALKQKGLKARVLLQVHDEIIVEVPQEEVEDCRFLLTRVMEKAWVMDIPLRVNVEEGSDWGQMH